MWFIILVFKTCLLFSALQQNTKVTKINTVKKQQMQINEVDQCSFPLKIASLLLTCVNYVVKPFNFNNKIKKYITSYKID